MRESGRSDVPQAPRRRLESPLVIAGGGLAAAFGAASCCGLPVLLGSVGLGSGWLATIAWVAAPHRVMLLIAAAILLAAGAGAFLWRRRAAFCRTEISTGRMAANALLLAMLLVGGGLAMLSYLYS